MDPLLGLNEAEVQEIKSYIKYGDLSSAAEIIKNNLENVENAPLNIAVTGESGAGKSTFVNTFLELSEEGAAPTGVVETTMEPKAYSHPKYKNVKYWDLPGIGTPNFKAEDYLEKVHFKIHDFFIIIASERFRECNLQLARAIQAMGKKFYFVRSKIDQDVANCKRQKKKSFDEKTMLKEVREDCLKCFRKGNINNPRVFLLDSLEKGQYDHNLLQETMEKELPDHKRYVFLLSLSNSSQSVLEKKREVLSKQIWKIALMSCAVTASPIPGLGIACDHALLGETMRGYQARFGVDEDSLKNLSKSSGKSLEELRSVMTSPQVLTEDIVIKMISRGGLGTANAVKNVLSCIPLIGSLAAGCLAFGITYDMLNDFLGVCAEDAQRVLEKACEN